MYGVLLALHLIAATIWTGGHLVLSLVLLPKILRDKSVPSLLNFEQGFEKIGLPALVIQVITGLMLAYRLLPDVSAWFDWTQPVSLGISIKVGLLTLTLLLALDARFRVLPKLSKENLMDMALHIVAVTVISVLFVLAGVSFRVGWLY